ncbi:unnamed protein product [Haemonchus placei]|uniref:Fibronectin type-III domain-containing protein n=1 Tax=Haemonchus placei TaxID=6290 RepID=A0A0N4WJK5_HAEPC|nr:unnamed protein product [Haemonchus placei]
MGQAIVQISRLILLSARQLPMVSPVGRRYFYLTEQRDIPCNCTALQTPAWNWHDIEEQQYAFLELEDMGKLPKIMKGLVNMAGWAVQSSSKEKCSGFDWACALYAESLWPTDLNVNPNISHEPLIGLAQAGSAVMSSVQLVCQNPIVDDEYGETVEAFVSISLLRPSGPTRYVIRWRQRSQLLGNRDEAQWITASVEPGTFFKVRGLIPGVQYSFMVTAVGPSGRLGNTITSPWTEILSSATVKAPTPPLTLKNGYNTDRGVIAQLEWPRTPQDSCYYKLQLSNSSSQTNRDVELVSF